MTYQMRIEVNNSKIYQIQIVPTAINYLNETSQIIYQSKKLETISTTEYEPGFLLTMFFKISSEQYIIKQTINYQPTASTNNTRRMLDTTQTEAVEENENHSILYQMFFILSQIGGFYSFLKLVFGSVINRIYDSMLMVDLVNKYNQIVRQTKLSKQQDQVPQSHLVEARSALQAEIMGIIEDVERIPQPYCKSVDLDFRISGPAPYSHLDMKHPIGSLILKKQNSPYTLQESSLNLGKSIIKQKKRFCGLEQGPISSRNVLHIVDLCYVPKNQKEIVRDLCIKGAGSPEGILFINTK